MNTVKKAYQVDTILTPQKVCKLINSGKVNDLPVTSWDGISQLGAIVNLHMGHCASSIDDTHVLFIFIGQDYHEYAVVLTINSNNTVSVGTICEVTTATTNNIDVAKLSTNKFVNVYQSSITNSAAAIVLIVNTDYTISKGTEKTWGSSNTGLANKIQPIDSAHALVAETYNSSTLVCLILTININNTITAGTINTIYNNGGVFLNLSNLDSTHFVVSAIFGSKIRAIAVTVDGTTVTWGNMSGDLISAQANLLVSCPIDHTHAMFAYRDGGGTDYIYKLNILVITIDGTTITVSSACRLDNCIMDTELMLSLINTNHVLVGYNDYNTYFYNALILTINGDLSVSPSNVYTLTKVASAYITQALLNSGQFLFAYRSNLTTNCELMVFKITGEIIYNAGIIDKPLGVAQDSAGTVVLKGLSKGHTGLASGSTYYYNPSTGDLTLDSTNNMYIGIAISDSILLIPDYIIK